MNPTLSHHLSGNDFIVVGAGISGQLLARALARRGLRVVLVHDPAQAGASRVAAWMVNPVTGIRFVPSWRVDWLLPEAIRLYGELEQESGLKIWHPLSIRRYFQGNDEIPRWEKKRNLPEVRRFILEEHNDGVTFHSGGWADLSPWLQWHLQHPSAGVTVVEETITRQLLERDLPRNARAVFCTGYHPSALPWKPAKGELLTVRIPGLRLDQIRLRGIFVIPIKEDVFRVGATYEWDDLSADCTNEARDFLTKQLTSLVDVPFEVLDAQTAIRPILRDARPVIGMEPGDPRFGVCNGFGSKAALQAPAITEHFADHLLRGTLLDPEMDLARL